MKWAEVLSITTKASRQPPAAVRLIVKKYAEVLTARLADFETVDMMPLGKMKIKFKQGRWQYNVNTEATIFVAGRWLVYFDDLHHFESVPYDAPRQQRPMAEDVSPLINIDLLTTRQDKHHLLLSSREIVASGEKVPFPEIGTFYRYELKAGIKWDEWNKVYIEVPERFKVAMKPAETIRKIYG
jgi:nucleoid DNA-binding protein